MSAIDKALQEARAAVEAAVELLRDERRETIDQHLRETLTVEEYEDPDAYSDAFNEYGEDEFERLAQAENILAQLDEL